MVLKVILALLLPPVAAFMQVKATTHFWVNIVLCLFFWVPGVLHALWLVITDQK